MRCCWPTRTSHGDAERMIELGIQLANFFFAVTKCPRKKIKRGKTYILPLIRGFGRGAWSQRPQCFGPETKATVMDNDAWQRMSAPSPLPFPFLLPPSSLSYSRLQF